MVKQRGRKAMKNIVLGLRGAIGSIFLMLGFAILPKDLLEIFIKGLKTKP
jgi:NhaP-type Na+/H+ and K+/H+ antiporter